LIFVPRLAIRRAAREPKLDPLVALRSLFLTFCAAILMIGGVVVVVGDVSKGSEPTGLSVAIIVAVGCFAPVAQRLVSRPLDCTSAESLASSYWTRFFLRLAFSESVALVGFVIGISMGPWWVYYVGAGFTAVGYWQLAPTRHHLSQDQDALMLRGCARSLVSALRSYSRSNGPQAR
jgi:hypothetical protein